MREANKQAMSLASMAGVALALFAPIRSALAASYQVVATLPSDTVFEGLAADSSGNLYVPGTKILGVLYELSAKSKYAAITTLHTFSEGDTIGFYLNGLAVTDHNLILGTTDQGGPGLYGTVFNLGKSGKLSPMVLHGFTDGSSKPTDGEDPSGLVSGSGNRYYGTTTVGGLHASKSSTGSGIVFYVTASTDAPKYAILHKFGGPGDGTYPTAQTLAVDATGNLYGLTYAGGANGVGTVFMMQYGSSGWQEQVVYSFTAAGLDQPTANAVLDAQGNLYGCAQGGPTNRGGMFRLSPPATPGGAWTETDLYKFGSQPNDPVAARDNSQPFPGYGCGITIDPTSGIIVGTSFGGGVNSVGTLFTLTPPTGGGTAWTETVGYSFTAQAGHPVAPPLKLGGIYYGGNSSNGDIYAFTP